MKQDQSCVLLYYMLVWFIHIAECQSNQQWMTTKLKVGHDFWRGGWQKVGQKCAKRKEVKRPPGGSQEEPDCLGVLGARVLM